MMEGVDYWVNLQRLDKNSPMFTAFCKTESVPWTSFLDLHCCSEPYQGPWGGVPGPHQKWVVPPSGAKHWNLCSYNPEYKVLPIWLNDTWVDRSNLHFSSNMLRWVETSKTGGDLWNRKRLNETKWHKKCRGESSIIITDSYSTENDYMWLSGNYML